MVEAIKKKEPFVALQNVSKTYRDGSVQALDSVSLEIDKGEFVCITGPSGCGKSTLLNMLGLLDQPTQGSIWFLGNLVTKETNLDRLRSKEIGFVFQAFYLLPNLTAEENVQIPMMESSLPASERANRARDLLVQVGLEARKDHLPSQLSIGQRQRVAIARALANGPSLILADEPTGNLDRASGHEIVELLIRLHRDLQTTLVIVTHDHDLASRAERVIQMSDGKISDPYFKVH